MRDRQSYRVAGSSLTGGTVLCPTLLSTGLFQVMTLLEIIDCRVKNQPKQTNKQNNIFVCGA